MSHPFSDQGRSQEPNLDGEVQFLMTSGGGRLQG